MQRQNGSTRQRGMLYVGRGRVLLTSKTVAQRIRALVTASGNGYIYDVSDLGSMSQDSAGTIPAAVGQPAGRLLDKSGFGNHLIQATDAKRYVLRQSGSVYWLEGGSGRFLYSAAAINLTATAKFSHFFAEKLNASASIGYATRFGTAGPGYFDVRHKDGVAGDTAWNVTAGGIGLPRIKGRTTPYTYINGMVADVTQAAANSTNGGPCGIKPRYNGVPAIYSTQGGAWSTTTAFGNNVLSYGAAADGSFPADCNFYGAVGVASALTETQCELVERYLDAKAGSVSAAAKAVYAGTLGDSITAAYLSQDSVHSLIQFADGAPGVGGIQLALSGRNIAQGQTAWEAVPDYSRLRLVTIALGANDNAYAEAASVAIARLQSLVNSVNARKPAGCLVYICSITPDLAYLITTYGAVNGPIANQKRLDMNTAIEGGGATPITGASRVISSHVAALDDGAGNLAAAYDTGDGIHPNNAGRLIIASAIRAGMVLDGLLS